MIYNYEIINPKTLKNLPHYNSRGDFVIPNVTINYRYYVEAARYNDATLNMEYYFLLGTTEFDKNCRRCVVDMYSTLHLKTHGDIDAYIRNECKSRGNVSVEYLESCDTYDVYIIK